MTAKRANWFEAFESIVQFYPKMTAIIVFSSMAALGRMMPSNRVSVASAKQVETPRPPAMRPTKRHGTAHKTSKRSGPTKRTSGRRNAA